MIYKLQKRASKSREATAALLPTKNKCQNNLQNIVTKT